MRRLVDEAMRAWAPRETPREELVRRLHDAYDAGYSTMRAFRDSGDVADILDQWGGVLDKCRLVIGAIEAHRGTTDAELVLNRFNDFWDYDLKPIWSAIDRGAAEA